MKVYLKLFHFGLKTYTQEIMNVRKLVSFVFLASLINVYGQDSKSFKRIFMDAEYHFITENYLTAHSYYEDLLILDPDNSNLHYLSGYC